MKKHVRLLLFFASLLCGLPAAHAQIGLNAPVGLKPVQDMEIYSRNGVLAQKKFTFTTVDPNASVNTLSCAASPPLLQARAGILKDPGGDSNYPASLTCTQTILHNNDPIGYELTFEDLDTEAGNDLVIITDFFSNTLAFSGSSVPAPFFVPGYSFSVRFQANTNGTVGRGFQLRWREVYPDNTAPATPATAFGNAFQFDVNKGALLSGLLTIGAVQKAGLNSTALGYVNTASGDYSTALGNSNIASSAYAIALGNNNTASTDTYATALGFTNAVTGRYAIALGSYNTASSFYATALGLNNIASGYAATAMGGGASTGGFQGAMNIGDYANFTAGITNTASTANNQLTARFNGGFRFISAYTVNTGAITAGVVLAPGSNSWAAISDSTKKERFQSVNQVALLHKLSTLKLGTWNYKGQPDQRHYGPMAQDFFARFGHDGVGTIGCDTLLAGHDFTAVTLAGVQALIQENEQLKARLTQSENRLEALEALLVPRRRGRVVARK